MILKPLSISVVPIKGNHPHTILSFGLNLGTLYVSLFLFYIFLLSLLFFDSPLNHNQFIIVEEVSPIIFTFT